MSTEKQDLYLVKRDGKKTTLFCVFSREMEVPRKYTFHEENAMWVYAKELEEVLTHRDQFPEYVEISADEATKIMEMLNSENAKKEEEKNVIRVTHKQIEIQNEIVDIDIYRKDAKRRLFREQDLEKLLMDLINADHGQVTDFNPFEDFKVIEDEDDLINDHEATVRCVTRRLDNIIGGLTYGKEYKAIGRDKAGLFLVMDDSFCCYFYKPSDFIIVDDPHGILKRRSVYYSYNSKNDEVRKY